MNDLYTNTLFRTQALGLTVVATAVYGITIFLVYPLHTDLNHARQTLSQVKEHAEQLSWNIDQLKLRQATFIRKEKEIAERFTSPSEHSEDPLQWLKRLTEKTGLSITTFNDQRRNDSDSVAVIDINLTAACDYLQLCDFLHQIERSSRPCFVNHLRISNSCQAIQPLAITTKLRIFPANEALSKLSKKNSSLSPANNSLVTIPSEMRKQ